MIRASIIGANGYTGFELMRLIERHPFVSLHACASRKEAGEKISRVFPELSFFKDKAFCDSADFSEISNSDIVFSCLPHGASAEVLVPYIKKGVKIIDLSADFRFSSLELYEKTYKTAHVAREYLGSAVYGLCELNRERIKGASLIGNPGCYTTSAILPLYPLIKDGIIHSSDIIIDAKSGISGAGRKAELALSFCETSESFKAYGLLNHRHTPEIEEVLTLTTGAETIVSFTPHLLPIRRGILSTIYARLANPSINEEAINQVYEKYYGGEHFVEVLADGALPEIKHVLHTNSCKIGFKLDRKNGRIILISCLDNLLKGASGQAIQNLNIMFGLNETAGLI